MTHELQEELREHGVGDEHADRADDDGRGRRSSDALGPAAGRHAENFHRTVGI